MEKTDCIFYLRGKCFALDSTYCRIENECSFYKPDSEWRLNNMLDRYAERRDKENEK